MADTYRSVGKIRKPHGLSGAFSFGLTREPKSLKKLPNHFFLESKGSYIPFFVKTIELKSDLSGYLQLEEISNPEEAKRLSNSELFLEEKLVASLFKKDADDYGFLLDYMAYDGDKELGKVTDIMEMPGQVLAEVDISGNETLIPLVDDLITEIDRKGKKIVFRVPEGLY